MTTPADENSQRVVKFVQELLVDMGDRAAVTPALIGEKIWRPCSDDDAPNGANQLNREAVTDELIRRFSLWVGQDSTLQSARRARGLAHLPPARRNGDIGNGIANIWKARCRSRRPSRP